MASNSNESFQIRVVDESGRESTLTIHDGVPTGRQILLVAAMQPPNEFQLLQFRPDRRMEEVGPDETIRLTAGATDVFYAFRSDRVYYFTLDDRRFPWGRDSISESMLRHLAGVGTEYTVWQERRGAQEDLRIEPGQSASLSAAGVEVFFTGKDQTTAGDGLGALPRADQRYILDHQLAATVVSEGGQTGVVVQDFQLPPDLFDTRTADMLIMLPPGYPDSPPDMFYTKPWLKLARTNTYPHCADQPHSFAGSTWQRWSRHSNEWRPGLDSLRTVLSRVTTAMENAN